MPRATPKRSQAEKHHDLTISEYIQSKIGMEPNAWGSKRRWHFLRAMANHLYEVKQVNFNKFFIWATAHCQCMKLRTLREDYLDTLERLDFVSVDSKKGTIAWKVENYG
jgi:hypothetical protein